MIAVIADDFTGAAELAGIARRYQLTVQLCIGIAKNADADLIIISTDSRSKTQEAALEATQLAIQSLLPFQPLWIYKKTDSVLRGYVVAELLLQLELQKMNKAILLPANPSLGRTIHEGCYYVNGISIEQTNFNTDPEFAIRSPKISHMLRAKDNLMVHVVNTNMPLPENGIIVGEATKTADLEYWLDQADEATIFAGAGDAFELLLLRHTKSIQRPIQGACKMQLPALYINGSKFSESVQLFIKKDASVLHFFSAAILSGNKDQVWLDQIKKDIQKNQVALIAIDDAIVQALDINALDLRNRIANITKDIITQLHIKELCIEGGATAAAILQALSLDAFIPMEELARGVIRMKATRSDLYIIVKPGSYALPESIVQHYLN